MKIQRNNQGFSLTELLVAMVIAGVVLSALYSQYLTQQRAYETTEAVTDAQQNLRAAMFMLERDVRMAGYDPTDGAAAGFSNATGHPQLRHTAATLPTTSYVCFSWDRDEDGAIADEEWIAYTLNNNNLVRADSQAEIDADTTGSTWDVIANGISGVTFDFFSNGSGVSSTGAADIRIVDITMRAERTTRDPSNPFVRDLRTQILCRNMGL
jgi:type IV pilus assembly protein PilW